MFLQFKQVRGDVAKTIDRHSETMEAIARNRQAIIRKQAEATIEPQFSERIRLVAQEANTVRWRRRGLLLATLSVAALVTVARCDSDADAQSPTSSIPTVAEGGVVCYLTREEFPEDVRDEVVQIGTAFCRATDPAYGSTIYIRPPLPTPLPGQPNYTG